jgi:hypothetical protein
MQLFSNRPCRKGRHHAARGAESHSDFVCPVFGKPHACGIDVYQRFRHKHCGKKDGTVYLAFDDAKGENHMRRPLPHVDFTKLEPAKPMTFEETLLAPAFEPGMYSISLWIPSNDTALKFERAHN